MHIDRKLFQILKDKIDYKKAIIFSTPTPSLLAPFTTQPIMKNLSYLILAILGLTGLLSCQNQEDMDQNLENLEPIEIADTVFQFGIAHAIKEDNTSPSETWFSDGSELINIVAFYYNDQIGTRNITLPWFTQGNTLNLVNNKINPAGGWQMISSNLGSVESPVRRPYFFIFNKQLGKIYFFVYNIPNQAGSYAVGQLEIRATSGDSKLELTSKQTKFNQFDSWFNFEFDLEDQNLEIVLNSKTWQLLGTGVQISTLRTSN
jgi:hypothetical protein